MEYAIIYTTPLNNIRVLKCRNKDEVLEAYKKNPKLRQGFLVHEGLYNGIRISKFLERGAQHAFWNYLDKGENTNGEN